MKRAGNLWERVLEMENLREAFHCAARGKWERGRVRDFSHDLNDNLLRLRDDMESGTFVFGRFHRFEIAEPKRRVIHAAHFEERVAHHALMGIVEPLIERCYIDHTYACRVGKGRLAALHHARKQAGRRQWFLKADVRKYFDSIPHAGVMESIEKRIKDPRVIDLFQRIVSCHETRPGRGLPIGSLTSQHLANLYLAPLDRVAQEEWKVKYVRYMDDFVSWSDDKEALKSHRAAGREILANLGLEYKEEPYLNRTTHGMDFLGMRVCPGRIKASRTTKVRFKRKLHRLEKMHLAGAMDALELQSRVSCLLANVAQADGMEWVRGVTKRSIWTAAENGLEPREPRRQLEQQREQHALCEPQQEQPDEHEQQHRVSPRTQLK